MKKQILRGLLVSFVVIGILAFIKYRMISAAIAEFAKMKPPPVAVTTFIAKEQEWPLVESAVGTVEPVQGAVLKTEEAGRVSKIYFESGADVSFGQVLLELDTTVEHAQLSGALAELNLAKISAARQKRLREKNANSLSGLENAEASLKNAEAEVERIKAVIAKKKIVAPFSGRLGIRLINLGEMVGVGTPVVSIQTNDTLYVNFSLPQQVIANLEKGMDVQVTVDSYKDETFPGKLTAIDSLVDSSTRNISLQATINNPDNKLRPGMFVETKLMFFEKQRSIVIPTSSVSFAPYGDTVYVVEELSEENSKNAADGTNKTDEPKTADGKKLPPAKVVRSQIVKLGKKQGDLITVLSGLKQGEEIVSSGAFKLNPGDEIVANNKILPGSNLTPHTSDT